MMKGCSSLCLYSPDSFEACEGSLGCIAVDSIMPIRNLKESKTGFTFNHMAIVRFVVTIFRQYVESLTPTWTPAPSALHQQLKLLRIDYLCMIMKKLCAASDIQHGNSI